MQYRFRRLRAALLAVTLPLLLAGCESLQPFLDSAPKPTARIIAVNLQNITLEKIDMVFAVEVSNPYATSLPILDLGYAIGSRGNRFVEGSLKPSGSIPTRGSQVIQLPAIVRYAPLMQAVKGVRPGSVVPYKADLVLGVEAPLLGRLDLPLSKSGEFPVPTLPEVELVSFDITRLALDKTQATAQLRLHNSNQFPLDISKMGIELALGGSRIASTTLARPANAAAGQTTGIAVPLSFSPRSFGTALFNLLRGEKATYSLIGSVEAGTPYGPISLPFNNNGSTPISR